MKDDNVSTSGFRVRFSFFSEISEVLAFFDRQGYGYKDLTFWDGLGNSEVFEVRSADVREANSMFLSEALYWEKNQKENE